MTWNRARWITGLAALSLSLVLSACGGSHGDVAACKAAMTAQYANALSNPSASPASKPPACDGLSDDQITEIASQIIGVN